MTIFFFSLCKRFTLLFFIVVNRTSPSRPAPPQPAPRRTTSDRWTPSVSYFSSESGNVMRVVFNAPREEPSARPAPKEELSAEEQQQQLAEPSAPPAPLKTSALKEEPSAGAIGVRGNS